MPFSSSSRTTRLHPEVTDRRIIRGLAGGRSATRGLVTSAPPEPCDIGGVDGGDPPPLSPTRRRFLLGCSLLLTTAATILVAVGWLPILSYVVFVVLIVAVLVPIVALLVSARG